MCHHLFPIALGKLDCLQEQLVLSLLEVPVLEMVDILVELDIEYMGRQVVVIDILVALGLEYMGRRLAVMQDLGVAVVQLVVGVVAAVVPMV
jgi:hypothetical protein